MVKTIFRGLGLLMLGLAVAAPFTTATASAAVMKDCHNKVYSQRRWNSFRRSEDCVKVIQQTLNEARLLYKANRNANIQQWPPLVVDGKFGPQTRKAVIAYQNLRKQQGLRKVDGIVGPETWWYLTDDCLRVFPTWDHRSQMCRTNTSPQRNGQSRAR